MNSFTEQKRCRLGSEQELRWRSKFPWSVVALEDSGAVHTSQLDASVADREDGTLAQAYDGGFIFFQILDEPLLTRLAHVS